MGLKLGGREHEWRGIDVFRYGIVNALAQRVPWQSVLVAEHQHLRMVVADHILVGVTEIDFRAAVLYRDRKAGATVGIIAQVDAGQRRV